MAQHEPPSAIVIWAALMATLRRQRTLRFRSDSLRRSLHHEPAASASAILLAGARLEPKRWSLHLRWSNLVVGPSLPLDWAAGPEATLLEVEPVAVEGPDPAPSPSPRSCPVVAERWEAAEQVGPRNGLGQKRTSPRNPWHPTNRQRSYWGEDSYSKRLGGAGAQRTSLGQHSESLAKKRKSPQQCEQPLDESQSVVDSSSIVATPPRSDFFANFRCRNRTLADDSTSHIPRDGAAR
ncbi:hypothetical protein RB11553 [Rhodopirellula baltica SH 1]|uniref:Uncharacterized protein n=1 Tax=Rhodopirellula baltica (strain DSM 10527 / NCIMB 13988 / SH1) TaxID=243090 RepID=Q7UE60_RHOBA|nr:hypothetical protein RB11553 [Rhodopirellula baltica SH 1]